MCPNPTLQSEYDFLASLAREEEAGSLAKPRSVLLLWFLRNVMGIDEIDAYEQVCDGDLDQGIDGLYLERSGSDDDKRILYIFQSKYTESSSSVGVSSFDKLIAAANHFKTRPGLDALVVGTIEPKLISLINEYELGARLDANDVAEGRLQLRLVLVTSGVLNGDAKRRVDSTNEAEGDREYLTVYDLRVLGKLARAVAAPTAASNELVIRAHKSDLVILGAPGSRIALAPVAAGEIVRWPGIDDGTLFELNVRRGLKPNRVRAELDSAIRRTADHKDFLAFHNGLTVVCEQITPRRGGFIAKNASVVNGAQSTLAFKRANDNGALTDDLRVFVKFVEVAGRPQLAEGVSWRSNTQTAVNARNLVSNSGPQVRIHREFNQDYPEVFYEIKPDAGLQLDEGTRRLSNEDAAQMLCAVYNAMPWLAVKRLTLFESDNHAMIFGVSVTAAHVLLCDVLRSNIESRKVEFPEPYQQSWKLTRIVAMYLVGEMMRSVPELRRILDDPTSALLNRGILASNLDGPIRIAAVTLNRRSEALVATRAPDNFNRDFKNMVVLKQLGVDARTFLDIARQYGSNSTA